MLVLFCQEGQALTRLVSNGGTDSGDCTGAACASISYAISVANPGDTIEVSAGIYNEELIIDKSITLLGALQGVAAPGRTGAESTITPTTTNLANGTLIEILASNVTIDGFQLDGNDQLLRGIYINGFGDVSILNCNIKKFTTDSNESNPNVFDKPVGILGAGASTGSLIRGNVIDSISEPAISLNQDINVSDLDPADIPIPSINDFILGSGVCLAFSCYANIQDNEIQNCTQGILIDNFDASGQASLIQGNVVDARLQGITLKDFLTTASLWTVQNNTLNASVQGLNASINVDVVATVPILGETTIASVNGDLTTPNVGITLSEINVPVLVSNNDISTYYYGYTLFGIDAAANLEITGGNISGGAQGLSCINEDTDGDLAASTFKVSNVNMSAFNGVAQSTLPTNVSVPFIGSFDVRELATSPFNFHAGVYLFSSGNANATHTIQATVENCNISGTGSHTSPCAGIYANNFSATRLIDLEVNGTDISNHQNIGVHLNTPNVANFNNCTINGNGSGGFDGAGAGINVRPNTTNISFNQCFIENASALFGALVQSNTSTRFFECSIAIPNSTFAISFDQTDGPATVDASACWWGSNVRPPISNAVDYTPWLNTGDADTGTAGFQGDFSFLNVTNADAQTQAGGRIQEAHDLLDTGGTIRVRHDIGVTYNESLVVTKSLTWVGPAANTVIQGLEMNGNNQTLTLSKGLQISNTLTLNAGIINTGNNTLLLSNNNPNALQSTNAAWVNGALTRSVQVAQLYEFPVGTATSLEAAEIQLNNQSGLSNIEIEFIPQDPINHPSASSFTPFSEGGEDYGGLLMNGYWSVSPNAGTANFNLNVFPTFLGGEPGVIVKRELPNTIWFREGNPQTITGGLGRTNIAGFSNFAVATNSGALPLTWLGIKAFEQDGEAFLTWRTANEVNTDRFEIERSEDALNFRSIGSLKAQNIGNTRLEYQFKDASAKDLNANPLYYRVKQIDSDGKFDYSATAVLWRGVSLNPLVENIYPNPSPGKTRLELSTDTPTQLEVRSANGQLISTHQINAETIDLDLSNLPPGLYLLQFKNGAIVEEKKYLIR